MSGPLILKKSIIAAKIETTPGTAVSLATGDTAFNCYNVDFTPDIEMTERNNQAGNSALPSVVGKSKASVKFVVDCAFGSAAPAWLTTFMPACAVVKDVSLAKYAPVTAPPGVSGVKTITIGFYEDGVVHTIRGAMGNPVIIGTAGGAVYVEFTFTGVYGGVVEASILTQTLPALPPAVRYCSASISSASFKSAEFKIDFGNNVYVRDAQNNEGLFAAVVTDRKTIVTLDVESDTASIAARHALLKAMTTFPVVLNSVGLNASALSCTIPKAQLVAQPYKDRGGIRAEDLSLKPTIDTAIDDDIYLEYVLSAS